MSPSAVTPKSSVSSSTTLGRVSDTSAATFASAADRRLRPSPDEPPLPVTPARLMKGPDTAITRAITTANAAVIPRAPRKLPLAGPASAPRRLKRLACHSRSSNGSTTGPTTCSPKRSPCREGSAVFNRPLRITSHALPAPRRARAPIPKTHGLTRGRRAIRLTTYPRPTGTRVIRPIARINGVVESIDAPPTVRIRVLPVLRVLRSRRPLLRTRGVETLVGNTDVDLHRIGV